VNDYWLAKLISSVDEVDSRKRLQKTIYLLQLAGCPLKCEYILHYYGPYSFELANLIDQLEGASLITETPEQTGSSVLRYKTRITEKGKESLEKFEKTSSGADLESKLKSFLPLFMQLNQINLWVLELAATIAFFHQTDWSEAKKQAAKFKKVPLADSDLQKAEELAKEFKKAA
jgi:uncharacterized protein YwgA